MASLDDKSRASFTSKHYGIAGAHSAVEICLWNKNSLTGKGTCYKEKFYGVDAHRCAQMSPMVAWCEQNCLHCWRPMEMFRPPSSVSGPFDKPGDIIKGIIEQRRKLLTGFKGNTRVSQERYSEAVEPSHWAISLSGEATLYPMLPELIREIKSLPSTRTVFLVTNGQEPRMLQRLADEDALPTQLYISLIAPERRLFGKLALPFYKDGWERLSESLKLWKGFRCRRVLRITLIRGINDGDAEAEGFASIISNASPDFVETKSYMHIGYSRHRLERKNMPLMDDVETFTRKMLCHLEGYSLSGKDETSRITLLHRDSSLFGLAIA